jgi:hypothetical protein
VLVLLPGTALAQRETTRDALSRLEESLSLKVAEQGLRTTELLPALVVDVSPAFEQTRAWFPAAALSSLSRVFGSAGLRSCEACLAPRTVVEHGRLEQTIGAPSLSELVRLDEASRGTSAPARVAIWLQETSEGVSLRIVDLHTARIVLAQNFDPQLQEEGRSLANAMVTRELERRQRGDSLAHTFIDIGVLPGQHVSLDWLEQWGDTNANLSGFSFSAFDPVLGLGVAYFRVIPQAFNLMVGAKLFFSVPTALVKALSQDSTGTLIDPLLTALLMVRVPLFHTNYALMLSMSTNGRFTVGISLLNFSLLPFLP